MVKKACAIAMSLALGVVLLTSGMNASAASIANTQDKGGVNGAPVLRMKNWSDSSIEEKNSFLLGMVTSIGLNKYWMENKHGKVYEKSPTMQWVKALEGVTFAQMVEALDTFAAENPGEQERAVIEVLWYKYCKPAGTPLPALRY